MKIFGMGGLEFVIILVVVLLIFGPKNLPKLGSALGKTISNLREGMGAGKKKKKAEEEAAAAEAQDSKKNTPVEISGELTESVSQTSDDADAETIVFEEEEVSDDNAPAVQDASDSAPKKVRRVVKRKASEEATEETVDA